jgi:hypothetical protein
VRNTAQTMTAPLATRNAPPIHVRPWAIWLRVRSRSRNRPRRQRSRRGRRLHHSPCVAASAVARVALYHASIVTIRRTVPPRRDRRGASAAPNAARAAARSWRACAASRPSAQPIRVAAKACAHARGPGRRPRPPTAGRRAGRRRRSRARPARRA